MSAIYDNWERLVAATLKREEWRESALASSRETSFSSSLADDASYLSHTYSFNSALGDILPAVGTARGFAGRAARLLTRILAAAIQLTNQVIKVADEAATFKQECTELKSKLEKLAALLRQAATYTEQVLGRALVLVHKCRGHGLVRRVFTFIPADAFRKMSAHLENSIGDVSWLLRVSASADDRADDEIHGLPPIAANEPILCLIWEHIAVLSTVSPDDRASAAESLVSLARDNDRYGKLIIEEGGVGPLLKLVKEGKLEGQENAARTIGLLGKDPESVEHMVHAGVCQVFVKLLKEGPMKVQAVVAWAVSVLASHYPKCQDLFELHNIIRLFVGHLAFETVQEHSKYAVASKATTMHAAVVLASTNNSKAETGNDLDDEKKRLVPHPLGHRQLNQMHSVVAIAMAVKGSNKVNSALNNHHHQPSHSLSGTNNRAREMEDSSIKANIKSMSARALCYLAKGNSSICRSITETRALLCFAVLLEKGPPEVQYNSAMALMEITEVAEDDAELRRSAFKPNSPACKAVVDQLFLVIEKADSELLVPCIKTIGNLARTFKATETRMIGPLVKLLDEREAVVTKEACIALTKFACSANYLHQDHSKAIIEAGGAKHLVQLVYFGEHPVVQRCALILLCYITMDVPESEELARAEVLAVLEWASKQAVIIQVEEVENLLPEAKGKLELSINHEYAGDTTELKLILVYVHKFKIF